MASRTHTAHIAHFFYYSNELTRSYKSSVWAVLKHFYAECLHPSASLSSSLTLSSLSALLCSCCWCFFLQRSHYVKLTESIIELTAYIWFWLKPAHAKPNLIGPMMCANVFLRSKIGNIRCVFSFSRHASSQFGDNYSFGMALYMLIYTSSEKTEKQQTKTKMNKDGERH